jgi:hypothetical protein
MRIQVNFMEMKKLGSFIIGGILFINSSAQLKPQATIKMPADHSNAVSLGAVLPAGNFSNTHSIGIAAQYARTNHRLGLLNKNPAKLFGLIGQAGAAYYFGKKETVSSYSYTYPRYIFLHIYGGAIINPAKEFNISLTTGPAIGSYNGNSQFNIGFLMEGNYYFNKKFGVAPSLHCMKESGADPLWAASLKAIMTF